MPRKKSNGDALHHMPLHRLPHGRVATAGRLQSRPDGWFLTNAHRCAALEPIDPLDKGLDDTLVRVEATWTGEKLEDASVTSVYQSKADERPALGRKRAYALGEAMRRRAKACETTRSFFEQRSFLEVDTPHWVEAPGTDVYLDPVRAQYRDDASGQGDRRIDGYLHTSPEFAMKRLLAEGFERIWQMAKVWRNGEVGPLHNPEFTILEWYRAWEPLEAIIDDVESLVLALLGEKASLPQQASHEATKHEIALEPPFPRLTMQELVEDACGFDLLESLSFEALFEVCEAHRLLSESSLSRARTHERWDELFFELQITHLEPHLSKLGAVFVTEWPSPLAVLARKKPTDPRVAERFELYIGGVELANGFQELTDPDEQRRRFEKDLAARRERGLPRMPMPEHFLEALEWGLPPSAGVAVGFDRLLMLAIGAADIREVMPFAMRRDPSSGQVNWG